MKNLAAFALLLLPAAQAQDPRARVEELQKKIAALGGEELRTDLDPAALAASLGYDVDKLLKFTQALPLHPYSGALRGAAGTLLAGAANDVDRCLLLQALLQSAPAKPAVRFAFGELTDAQAAALVARTLRSVPGLPGTRRVPRAEILARVGETEAGIAAVEERMARSGEARVKSFDGGFGADRADIDAALKNAGVVLSGTPGDGVEAAASLLRSHVWLQVEREGKWIDLDPSFPDAAVGWAPRAVSETKGALPDALLHRLTVRLFVERRDGAKIDSEALYAATRPLTELAGRAVNISILPAGFDAEKSKETLEKQAARFLQFQPVVDFGGTRENARVFDVQGRALQSKDGKFAGAAGDAAGRRVLGAMGRKQPTALAGLRLELEISAPGRKPHVEQRHLLNRVKPGTTDWAAGWEDDVRCRLALFKSLTIWPAAGMLNDSYLFDRISRTLVRDGGLPRFFFDAAPTPAQVAERLDPLPLGLVEVWQTALRLAQGAFAPGDGACFPDGASLLAWKEELTLGEDGKLRWRGGVDLLHAPLGCVAKSTAAAARARLLFGLLLSEGESSLMEGRAGTLHSTAAVFRKAREAKTPFVLLRGKAEGVTIGARAAVRVRADLEAGLLTLIPKEPVSLGGRPVTAWWRIDPATGACLGIGETGEGQAVSEGVLILEKISIPMVQRCMKFVVCLNVAIGAGRSMQDAGRECMTEFMKDYIKETVDAAVDQFIKDPLKKKATKRIKGGAAMMDPGLVELYEKAEETWGTANEAIDDLTFSGLRAKVAILLDMGNEIARYADEKSRQGR